MTGYLTTKYCGDPNPHGPHPWPLYADENPSHWCRGVEDALTARDVL